VKPTQTLIKVTTLDEAVGVKIIEVDMGAVRTAEASLADFKSKELEKSGEMVDNYREFAMSAPVRLIVGYVVEGLELGV
jgi:hypothetical protein